MFQKPLFRLIFMIGGIIIIINLSRSVYDLWRRQDIIAAREQVLSRLEDENIRLKQALGESQSPEFIEREARNRLGMSKPGESVALIQIATPEGQVNPAGSEIRQPPSWKLWWKLFF